MKILFLNGSARGNGNTNALLSMIAEQLDKNVFEARIINISDYKINYCLGCHNCEKTRKCIQNDDMGNIYNAFEEVDLICMASPSYWGYVTGQLKVFFDRSLPFCNAIHGKTTFPKGKRGIAISIRAGANEKESLEIIKAIEHYFSHLEITPFSNMTFESVRNNTDLTSEEVKKKISKFVLELNDWGRNRTQ